MLTLELHGTSELGVGADVLVVALFAGVRVPGIVDAVFAASGFAGNLGVKRFDCAIGGEDCRVVALLPLTLLDPEHDPDGPLTHDAPPREFEGTPRQLVTQKVTGVFCALSYLSTMHGGDSLSLRHYFA
jgi:hypothetical protein